MAEDKPKAAPDTTQTHMQPQHVDPAAEYGENCAEFYDEIYGSVSPGVLSKLQELSGGGRVLELGLGTGRMALPLAARGVDICGIEASKSMVARLRQKPGGDSIEVVQGNFADGGIEGPFSLVFAIVSTFFLQRSRAEQQRCINAVAQLLTREGVFLVENFEPTGATSDEQFYRTEQIVQTSSGPREYRVQICYSSPQQLDEMAQNAGLRLKDRWSNWRGQTYKPGEPLHVSLYERRFV